MARIANINQPVRSAVLTPVSVYSRVIALELRPPAGMGNTDYCFTPQLGNRLVLHSIDIWVYCGEHPSVVGGFFWLMYGSGLQPPGTFPYETWTHIIPLHCGAKAGFRWFACDEFHRHFQMRKLFTNNELRFGVAINNGFPKAWECTVAFEISEV